MAMKISQWKFWTIMLVTFLGVVWQNFTSPQEVNAANLQPAFFATKITSGQVATRPMPEWARLVDIQSLNRNIRLDIRYATPNNFLQRTLYPEARCILRAGVAQKLSRVQEDLQKVGLGLKVFDCYRPWSITKQMWEVLPDSRYVANPAQGSRHNRGAAVDLTLVDRQGRELEMPTEFDDFTERAGRNYQGYDVSETAQKNSRLLAQVMRKQGFIPLSSEWWHFDDKNWSQYSILDVSFGHISKPK
jgi:D-alanyl-D-alanine dipeptidase